MQNNERSIGIHTFEKQFILSINISIKRCPSYVSTKMNLIKQYIKAGSVRLLKKRSK